MRFEYYGDILDGILKRHSCMPIDFIYVNSEEMKMIEQCCFEKDLDFVRKSDWMTIEGFIFTIYETEKDEE